MRLTVSEKKARESVSSSEFFVLMLFLLCLSKGRQWRESGYEGSSQTRARRTHVGHLASQRALQSHAGKAAKLEAR